jgi:diguanylate cyclase (GGDEF)-like protein
MAASDNNTHEPPGGSVEFLLPCALEQRVREEISRAGRHGTALSCVHLDIEELDEIARLHGPVLAEHTVAYASLALRHELRDFDRVGRAAERELLVVLPGADGPRGEIVARRLLKRLRAIKLQAPDGERRALRMAIGVATWREGMTAESLLEQARAAASRERLVFGDALRL